MPPEPNPPRIDEFGDETKRRLGDKYWEDKRKKEAEAALAEQNRLEEEEKKRLEQFNALAGMQKNLTKEEELEEKKRIEAENAAKDDKDKDNWKIQNDIKDFVREYNQEAQTDKDASFARVLVRTSIFFNRMKPKDWPPFESLPISSQKTVATLYGAVEFASSGFIVLAALFPGAGLLLLINAVMTDYEKEQSYSQAILDFLKIDPKVMTRDQVKEQKQKIENPIPVITDKINLSAEFQYALEKNKLNVFKALNIEDKRLEERVKKYEKDNANNKEAWPYIAFPLGEGPFKNDIKDILGSLNFSRRQELFKTINESMLDGIPFASRGQNIRNLINVKNQQEYEEAYAKLTDEEKKILMAFCSVKKYEELLKSEIAEKLKAESEMHPSSKNIISTSAANFYLNKIELTPPSGLATRSIVSNVLDKARVNSISALKALPENKQIGIWEKIFQSGVTNSDKDGSNIKVSANKDIINTILHECCHANEYLSSAKESSSESSYKAELVEAFRKKLNSTITENVAKHFSGFNWANVNNKNMVIGHLEAMGIKPKFPNDPRFEEMVEMLSGMMNDPNCPLINHNGFESENNLPNIKNQFLRLCVALRYFKNLHQFPEYAYDIEQKIQEFEKQEDNKDLLKVMLYAFIDPTLSKTHYSMDNLKDQSNEAMARFVELASIMEKLSKGTEKSEFKGFKKGLGNVFSSLLSPDKSVSRFDVKDYSLSNLVKGIFEQIGRMKGAAFSSASQDVDFSKKQQDDHSGHNHSQGGINKGFFDGKGEKSHLSNGFNHQPQNHHHQTQSNQNQQTARVH